MDEDEEVTVIVFEEVVQDILAHLKAGQEQRGIPLSEEAARFGEKIHDIGRGGN